MADGMIDDAKFAETFKRQYLAREARRNDERASRVRELHAAQRQLMAERSRAEQPFDDLTAQQADDPLLLPGEGSESPPNALVLPNPGLHAQRAAAPSATARNAKAETSRAAGDNWRHANNVADARDAVYGNTDPTNPLGIPSAKELMLDVPARSPLDALPKPPAYGADRKSPSPTASPAPVRNFPESGTLPGEEQVTSMDVYNRLSPQEKAAIRQKYERGSHAHTESFEDYLGFQYGDMPPAAREAAMRAEYGSPGELSPLAQARVAAGKPLPEGLKPGFYTPEQMRGMSRDVYAPEVPRTYHGGTFTYNADGSRSSRAPEDYRFQDAQKAAEYYGEGSFEHHREMGKAYGIDVSQYDGTKPEDRALLAADVAREKERHDRLGTKYDTVRTPMGGTRYVANPEKMADAQAKADLAMSPQRKAEFANTIMTRFAGMITPEQVAALETMIQTPDGFAQMRAMNQFLTRQRNMEGMRSWRNKQANYNMTQQMANPNYAPGMAVRMLAEEVRKGDPMGLAVAYDIAGNRRGAADAFDLAMAERAGAAQLAQAEMAARNGSTPADRTLGAQFGPEMTDALRLPQGQREAAVATILRKSGTPEEKIDSSVQAIVLDQEFRTNPQGPAVQAHLQALRRAGKRDEFVDFLVRNGMPVPQAEELYRKSTAGPVSIGLDALGSAGPAAWAGAPGM